MEKIQITDFQAHTYEDVCGYPQIEIDFKGVFQAYGKHISHINLEILKQRIAETLKYEAVKLESITGNSDVESECEESK